MSRRFAAAISAAMLVLTPTAALADKWLAYAIDYQGGWRYSGTKDSRFSAEAEAFRMCWRFQGECDVVINVKDSCIALADNGDTTGTYAYGYASGYNRLLAETSARAVCNGQGEGPCRIVDSACP